MTKEDKRQLEELNGIISRLEPYKKHLDTALHGYINIKPEDTRRLLEAYFGPDWKSKVKPNVMTCGACKLSTVKNIAIEYGAAKRTVEMIMAKEAEKKEAEKNAAKTESKKQ